MLELIVLIVLGKNISAKARAKGRRGAGYVFLLVVLWIGCEIGGVIIAAMLSEPEGFEEPSLAICYLGGLVGAIVGACIAFAIVNSASSVEAEPDYSE